MDTKRLFQFAYPVGGCYRFTQKKCNLFSDYVGVADQVSHTWFVKSTWQSIVLVILASVRLSIQSLIKVSGVFEVSFRKRIDLSSKRCVLFFKKIKKNHWLHIEIVRARAPLLGAVIFVQFLLVSPTPYLPYPRLKLFNFIFSATFSDIFCRIVF